MFVYPIVHKLLAETPGTAFVLRRLLPSFLFARFCLLFVSLRIFFLLDSYSLFLFSLEEKSRSYRLISNIMHYIVENDFYLIDITGKPTTW